MPNYTRLQDDLTELMGGWGKNENRTEFQKEQWTKNKISHDQISIDHENKIFLQENEKPIGTYMANSSKRFWSGERDHIFPTKPDPDSSHPNRPRPDLVRLGVFLHLDLYRTTLLMLKGLWEDFFAHEMDWPNKDLYEILRDEQNAKRVKQGFNPDIAALYEVFKEESDMLSESGYDLKSFGILVNEMIVADLHRVSVTSPEIESFAQRKKHEKELLKNSTKELEELFWVKQMTWLQFINELSENLYLHENINVEKANIMHRWYAMYGKEYIKMKEEATRRELLQNKIALKKDNIDMTMEELDQKLNKFIKETSENMEKTKYDVSVAEFIEQPPPEGPVDPILIGEIQKQCKEALKEAFFVIHPDGRRIRYSEEDDLLTDTQRESLDDLWHNLMKVKKAQVGFAPGQIGYNHRDLSEILNILAEGKAILEIAGIDTDRHLVIQGETIEEQIKWLEDSIAKLEASIKEIKADIVFASEDKDIKEKRSSLEASPEEQAKLKKKMLDLAEQYKAEADELEDYLKYLFKKHENKEIA